MITKYYAAVTEAGAGGATEVVESMTAAQALAKYGQKSDESGRQLEPIEIPGTKEEPKTEATPETATVKEEPKVEVAKEPTQETPKEEPKKAETAPIVQEAPKVQTLEEVLKTNQPDAILKGLGFDDEKASFVSQLKDADPKLVGIMQAYQNGTLESYVKELSTDYQKMTPEEVMRHQLRREYPKASAKTLNALYESEVVEKYKLDPEIYTEAEVEKGKLLLEAKADKYRDEFTANQEKYLLPKPPEPKKEVVPDNSAELQRQQIEAYRKELAETPFTKDIIANKKITFGEGAEKFSYPVDPNSLLDVLTDGQKWVDVMYDNEGGNYIPKVEHQLLVAAFAQDSKKFLGEYAKHLKSIGAKEVIEPIENASQPNSSTSAKAEPEPNNPAAAMAKAGRRVNGGYN